MSTSIANEFGSKYGAVYRSVALKWIDKLQKIEKITSKTQKEWSFDLRKALETDLTTKLRKEAASRWSSVGDIPKETLDRFVAVASRQTLGPDSYDLLRRLHEMTREAAKEPESVTAAMSAQGNLNRTVERSDLTAAQVFDMAEDRLDGLIGRFFKRKNKLTGRRRWRVGPGVETSRHARLDGQIRNESEPFTYKGESVFGPRPPGGSPASWSNCSCFLEYEKTNGDWVRGRV